MTRDMTNPPAQDPIIIEKRRRGNKVRFLTRPRAIPRRADCFSYNWRDPRIPPRIAIPPQPTRTAMRLAIVLAPLVLAFGPAIAASDDAKPVGPPATAPAGSRAPGPTRADEAKWLNEAGTAILGFGMLRVAPTKPGVLGSVTLRYEEKPSDYAAFDAVQLLVLPGDALAAEGRAFADRSLAWSRSAAGAYETKATFSVGKPALVLVGFGPFSGADTSRPLGTARAYTLEASDDGAVSRQWVDAEAGELTVKAWTAHPEVARGGPVRDAVLERDHWFEARLEIVYDRERLRAPSDPETPRTAEVRREADNLRARAKELRSKGGEKVADAAAEMEREADDLVENLAATDDRIPVPESLAARLRRLPFRWR
jgi:hypothetical protein